MQNENNVMAHSKADAAAVTGPYRAFLYMRFMSSSEKATG